MDKTELKDFVNKILEKKGFPPVKQFCKEFADGSKLFCWLINILNSYVSKCVQYIIWWINWL